jgi:hypothetical protein
MCIYIYISHSLFSTTRSMAGHTGTPPWVTMCMNDRTVQPRRFLADNSRIWQRSFCAQTLPLWQLWGDSSQKAWHRLCRTHRRWSPSPKTTGNTVITGNTWICRKRGFKKNHGKFPEIPGWNSVLTYHLNLRPFRSDTPRPMVGSSDLEVLPWLVQGGHSHTFRL